MVQITLKVSSRFTGSWPCRTGTRPRRSAPTRPASCECRQAPSMDVGRPEEVILVMADLDHLHEPGVALRQQVIAIAGRTTGVTAQAGLDAAIGLQEID